MIQVMKIWRLLEIVMESIPLPVILLPLQDLVLKINLPKISCQIPLPWKDCKRKVYEIHKDLGLKLKEAIAEGNEEKYDVHMKSSSYTMMRE